MGGAGESLVWEGLVSPWRRRGCQVTGAGAGLVGHACECWYF